MSIMFYVVCILILVGSFFARHHLYTKHGKLTDSILLLKGFTIMTLVFMLDVFFIDIFDLQYIGAHVALVIFLIVHFTIGKKHKWLL